MASFFTTSRFRIYMVEGGRRPRYFTANYRFFVRARIKRLYKRRYWDEYNSRPRPKLSVSVDVGYDLLAPRIFNRIFNPEFAHWRKI